MGLLEQVFAPQNSDAISALSAGLLRGDLAGGLLGAQAGFAAQQERARREQAFQMQMEQHRMALDEARRRQDFLNNMPEGPPTQSLLLSGVRAGAVPLGDYFKATAPRELPFNKVDPKDYTPESIQQFAQSGGDYTRLVPLRKADVVNGQAVDLYNTKPGTVFDNINPNQPFNMRGGQVVPNQAFQGYELGKAKAGATNVSLKVDNKMGESLAGQVGPMAKDSRVQADGAVKMFDAADRIERALNSNKVLAGPGASQIQTVRQFSQMVGGGNDEGIRQTRQVIKSLAQMSVEARKQLQGQGQVTESEAAAVAKADAGDINDLTVGELRDLVMLTKRAAHFTAKGHNDILNQLGSNQGTAGLVPFYRVPRMDELLKHEPKLPQIGSQPSLEELLNKYGKPR